jgi:hypothetical protein
MSDKESHSRSSAGAWKWISGVIVCLLASLGLWMWFPPQPSAPSPSKIALTELPEIAAGPQIIAKKTLGHAAAHPKSGEFEVCGVGKVKIDPDDAMAMGNYLEALAKKSHLRWFSALRNSDDLRARAAGLFLQGTIADRGADQVIMQEARDELVQLAVGANDPAVYALAIYKCAKNEDPRLAPVGRYRQAAGPAWIPTMPYPGCCSSAKPAQRTICGRRQKRFITRLRRTRPTRTTIRCSVMRNRKFPRM